MATCYRHPTRETGVSCSSCSRPICPDCMTPTPVGMRCPECSRKRTRVVSPARGADVPTVTYALIALNTIVEIASALSGGSLTGSGGTNTLIAHGALDRPAVAAGDYWRLVTSGFLHYGFFHLLVNMYALYFLGLMLEPAIGRLRFGLIYAVSLLAGSLGALIATPNALSAGASGAIFGLFGAALIVSRARGATQLASGLTFMIVLNLVFTFAIPGISIGGHVGGLAGGALTALVLFWLPDRLRVPASVAAVLSVGLGIAAVAGSVVVAG